MNNYNTYKLKNGLQVITTNMNHYTTCSIMASVKVGSKNENKKNNGISHFLEHVNFKGTKTYKNSYALSKELDAMGCLFNAYTSKYITVYHFKVAYNIEYISKLLHILSEILFECLHINKDINQEKNIIIEEIKQTLDDPYNYIDDVVAGMMFKNSPLAMDVGGSIKNIKNMTPDMIKQYYKKYYVPNNIILSIAGKIPSDIDKTIKTYFDKYPPKKIDIIPIKPYIFTSTKPELKVMTRKHSKQCQINVAFPAFPINDKNIYPLELLGLHLAGNMSSILYRELRIKNNLVYDVSSHIVSYEEGGYLTIATAVDSKNVNKTIEIILNESNNLFKYEFDNLEILKANQIHSKEMDWEDSYNIANYYANQLLLCPKITNIKDDSDKYKKISINDIKKIIPHIIDFRKMKIVVIGNIMQNDVKFNNILN